MIKNDMEKDVFKQQTGGSHYQGLAVTPIEYAMRNKLDACQFSVIKYITRFRDKNGLEDLNKCKDFVDMLIRSEYCEKNRKNIEDKAAHYSFNIESEVYNQLPKELQGVWKQELEQAYRAGAFGL